MKITFLGATHEVTGSCTLIEAGGKNILIDCGMEQGPDIFVNQDIPVNPGSIDCVLLTHAHIDHSGKLPLLCKNGFQGKIYATDATCNLCRIMLRDSAHIQEFEAEWRNRKAKRKGGEPYVPLYTMDDAECAISRLYPCSYNREVQVLENLVIRFQDISHLLGSACIEVWVTENGVTKKLVFSGDVGNTYQPIIKNIPTTVPDADYVVIESTYGDRYHDEVRPDHVAAMTEYIQRTLDRGGNVVIPSFAVGRTQEMLYFIREIKDKGLVKGHDNFPVYVDSPLANEATSVFLQCDRSCFDEETLALLDQGINPLVFPGLNISVSSDESKAINFDQTPKVIISSSGMCEAGRIRHHLKHNLWRKESLILFVGYQAVGTLGRIIFDGAKSVKLFGEEVAVNAEIEYLHSISGHADKQGLLNWISGFAQKPRLVFVNHGEDAVCESFRKCLEEEHGFRAVAPYSGTCFDLITGEPVKMTEGIRIEKPGAKRDPRAVAVFARLTSAASRLAAAAERCEGMSNKDLARFADQIEQLISKMEK